MQVKRPFSQKIAPEKRGDGKIGMRIYRLQAVVRLTISGCVPPMSWRAERQNLSLLLLLLDKEQILPPINVKIEARTKTTDD